MRGLPLPEHGVLGVRDAAGSGQHHAAAHLMCDARCPFCGNPMKLVSHYDVVELVAVESR
jgi:hypothetical protein